MTFVSNPTYTCTNCKKSLKESERPCPYCGTEYRDIKIEVQEEIKIHDFLSLKKFGGKTKDFLVHLKQGWAESRNKEKHPDGVQLKQLVDRENNLYEKKVVDQKTGEIAKDLTQPLTEHKNGSKT